MTQSNLQIILPVGDLPTSLWLSGDRTKPLLVFFHGLTGNHHGLKFIAERLKADYSIIIVDLPNHGQTAAYPNLTTDKLHHWTKEALSVISQHFKQPQLVIAHSFGCLAIGEASILRQFPSIFINPVPEVNPAHTKLSLYMAQHPFFYWISHWRLLAVLVGLSLLKIYHPRVIGRMIWNTWHSKISLAQSQQQAPMYKLTLEARLSGLTPKLVISSRQDNILKSADEQAIKAHFSNVCLKMINGGHLSILENPSLLAKLIAEQCDA